MVNTPQDYAYVVRTEVSDLCDPVSFLPVKVVYGFAANNDLLTIYATNADGSEYIGDISLLESCFQAVLSGGITIGTVDQGLGGASAWKIDGSAVTQPVSGTFFQATQPVSIASLPLPTGAATAALQTTGNTSFASIDGKTPALGQALAAASTPVVLTAAQISTLTPLSTVAVTQSTSPWVVSGTVTSSGTQDTNIKEVNGVAVNVGIGAAGTGTQRVAVSNDSSIILAAGVAEIGNVKNSGTFATQATQAGTWNINNISGTVSLPTGAATAAKQPALGAAGAASADVITVQGIASMVALKVDGSAVTQPVSGTLTGITNDVNVLAKPSSSSTYSPTNATSSAYEASRIAKASAGNLYGFSGYNAKTTQQFIQVHDSATLPADTAVPVIIITVPPSSNFSYDAGQYGRAFAAGITLCNSSTGPTKTIGTTDTWFDIQYK